MVRANLILLLACVLLCGCTLQKRHYRQGFYLSVKGHHAPGQAHQATEPHNVPERPEQAPEAAVAAQATSSRSLPFIPAAAMQQQIHLHHIKPESHPAAATGITSNAVQQIGASTGKRKVEPWGLVAFALSIGAWATTGYITLPLFVVGAILAIVSLNIMGQNPERYMLKTLSLVALIISLFGAALALYQLVLLLLA